MPRLTKQNPAYRKHASGQAVCTIAGKDHYLGRYATPASRAEYNRLVAEWLANDRHLPAGGIANDITVSELLDRFLTHAGSYYRRPDGSLTSEVALYKAVMRVANPLYGDTPAKEFGPVALDACRAKMVEKGWCRGHVNKATARLKSIWKWGVGKQLIPPMTHHGLTCVTGLKRGRTLARESLPVQPVPDSIIEQTLPFLGRIVSAMVRIQLRTAARPGEVCSMRTGDIDRSGDVWIYTPREHKNSFRAQERKIPIGPRAQELIKPFLKLDPDAYCFSPIEAERERREDLHAQRITPLDHGNSPGTNRKRNPRWKPMDHYTTGTYSRAVRRACLEAFPPPEPLNRADGESTRRWLARLTPEQRQQVKEWHQNNRWHVHQLRHTAGTLVRAKFGLEAAGAVLGHESLKSTEIYAQRRFETGRDVAAQVG